MRHGGEVLLESVMVLFPIHSHPIPVNDNHTIVTNGGFSTTKTNKHSMYSKPVEQKLAHLSFTNDIHPGPFRGLNQNQEITTLKFHHFFEISIPFKF